MAPDDYNIELARWPSLNLRLVRSVVFSGTGTGRNWHNVLMFLGPLGRPVLFGSSEAMFEIRIIDPPGVKSRVDSVAWHGFYRQSHLDGQRARSADESPGLRVNPRALNRENRERMKIVRDASAWVLYNYLGIWPDPSFRIQLSTSATTFPIPIPMLESDYADEQAAGDLRGQIARAKPWQVLLGTPDMLDQMRLLLASPGEMRQWMSFGVTRLVDATGPPREVRGMRSLSSDPKGSYRFRMSVALEKTSSWIVDFLFSLDQPRVEIREPLPGRTTSTRVIGTGPSLVEAFRDAGLILPESEMLQWLTEHALPASEAADISIWASFGQPIPLLWPDAEFLEWASAIGLPGIGLPGTPVG